MLVNSNEMKTGTSRDTLRLPKNVWRSSLKRNLIIQSRFNR